MRAMAYLVAATFPPPGRHLDLIFPETVAISNPLNIPAVVIRRAVFEETGTFCADLDYTGIGSSI